MTPELCLARTASTPSLHVDLPHDCDGIYDSTLEYIGSLSVQITTALYWVEARNDIGFPEDELPHLEWLAMIWSLPASATILSD